MKKRLGAVIKKSIHESLAHYFVVTSQVFVVLVLAGGVFLNIAASQTIDPRFIRLFNNDRNAYISFLRALEHLPEFPTFLSRASYWDPTIEREVFATQYTRQQKITELEAVLAKNPQARDALYALFQLYSAQGNSEKAQMYLQKAQEIDPSIK